jgi:voltage-gated potassium channel Kch
MLIQLAIGAGLIAATVAVQALCMSTGLRAFRWIEENRTPISTRLRAILTVICVLFLIIPIVADIALWATFYYFSAALPNFEEALYFSTVTFTTVGYGDIVLDRGWRQLASIEAINGWIIFGWATALIVAVVQRLYFRGDAPWGPRGQ